VLTLYRHCTGSVQTLRRHLQTVCRHRANITETVVQSLTDALYKHCTDTVQTLHRFCKTLYRHCEDIGHTLYSHCTDTVQIFHKHCSDTAQSLHRHVQTLYRHCTVTVQTVYYHCTDMVQLQHGILELQHGLLELQHSLLELQHGLQDWSFTPPKCEVHFLLQNTIPPNFSPDRARVGTFFYIGIQKTTPLSRFWRPVDRSDPLKASLARSRSLRG